MNDTIINHAKKAEIIRAIRELELIQGNYNIALEILYKALKDLDIV